MKCYNTYYNIHYVQEFLYNTTGTNNHGEQKAVSTPRELTKMKERKTLLKTIHTGKKNELIPKSAAY